MLVKAYTNRDSSLAPSKNCKAREQDASETIWKMEKLTGIRMDLAAIIETLVAIPGIEPGFEP